MSRDGRERRERGHRPPRGASVFVAGAYWYLYVRPDMGQTESAAPAPPASSLREVMSSLP